MQQWLTSLKARMIRSKFVKNLSWIFFGNVVHAVLQFLLNIYVARQFTTDSYGLINYANSLITFFTSIGTLGFNGVITKYFAADENKTGELLGTTILPRLIFSIASIALLQVIVRVSSPEEPQLAVIVLCQSTTIFFGSFDLLVYWFRFKSEANIVATRRLFAFAIAAVWRLLAVAVAHSIVAYVIGTALETAIFVALLLASFERKYAHFKFSFASNTLKSILRASYPFVFSAILSTIYGQTDKVMLKAMLGNTEVAIYSVALTLAGAISIIPQALIEGFRPDIMSFKMTNQERYRKRLVQLYAIVFWLCIAYCLLITAFAKPLIFIIYGKKYLDAVPALSLVVWYTSFSYFGAINNLYMVAENKTKWVQITTLFGAMCNVVLNYYLIPQFGILGAAAASLITQILANFVMLAIIPPLRENFVIVVEAITLRKLK